jgi:hypothetical protein
MHIKKHIGIIDYGVVKGENEEIYCSKKLTSNLCAKSSKTIVIKTYCSEHEENKTHDMKTCR